MVFIIMGVSGCGKTTVGSLLGQKLTLPFHDADAFHSPQARVKMQAGIPLDDADRLPWLKDLASHIAQWNQGPGAVLACSALKESYRGVLSHAGREDVVFIHLTGDHEVIRRRLATRTGHYFSPDLLQSQLDALETPSDAISIDIHESPEIMVSTLFAKLEKTIAPLAS